MKQQHHPTDLKSFEKGINSDSNKELLGTKQGEHVDARNMRSQTNDGDNYAKKKIKGEKLLYPNIDNRCDDGTSQPLSDEYHCMMTQEINNHIVEIWATDPAVTVQPALIRIDGLIVCMSNDFPVRADYPLQYDKNEACIGGEFFITDNRVRPMVFNIKDLLVNSGVDVGDTEGECTTKYFEGFNLELYVVGITSELFQMSFIKQATNGPGYANVLGTNGLVVGTYSYSYRYATEEGDRSGWSPISVMIPVLAGRNVINDGYHANAGNYGGPANVSSPTIWGNHLRLKYDNKSQFTFIEIRRDGWYSEDTISAPPVSEIIGAIPINEGLNVINILDYASPDQTEQTLTEEDLLDVQAGIQRAKSLRYFNNKLWLMNVGYREREISDEVELIDSEEPLFPVIQKIFKKGHVDPYNAAYYKSNMRGESYGYGLAFRDDEGNTTFVQPVVDDFQYPNRREPVTSQSQGMSYFGTVVSADIYGNAPVRTYEVFDHQNAKRRDVYPGEDAQDELETVSINTVLIESQFGAWLNPPPKPPTLVNILSEARTANPFNPIVGTTVPVGTYPYKVLHPTSQTDDESSYNRRINTHVYEDNGYGKTPIEYNPKAFGIDYYSMGAAFKGVKKNTIPEWVDGFSIVTTEPSRRVVAQGLGFYKLVDTDSGLEEDGSKQLRQLVCNFPDLDSGYGLYPGEVNNLIGEHGSQSPYRLELVSPLGFFSEFYSYYANSFSSASVGASMLEAGKRYAIDGIAHCRILKDSGDINPTWQGITALNEFVGFGGWRETTQNDAKFPGYDASNGGSIFTIDRIDFEYTGASLPNTASLLVTTVENVYSQQYTDGAADNQDFNLPGLKKWHEPVYAVNIVKDNAQVNAGIVTTYKHAGNYIKLRSKILESDGSNGQTAVLVSERWEDCIVDIGNTIQGTMLNNAYSNYERFVTVEDPINGLLKWVNVTQKTPAQVAAIQADITANGFAVVTDPSGSYDVYGVYTDSQVIEGTGITHRLHFDNLAVDSIVYVDYDSRIPIRFFSGDTYINDHSWAVLDNKYNNKGEPVDTANEFKFNVPFPYPMYALNPYIGLVGDCDAYSGPRYITNTSMIDTIGGAGDIWFRGFNMMPGKIYFDSTFFGFGGSGFYPARWRQLIASWVAETRISLAHVFNVEIDGSEADSQMYPLKNYVYRPSAWNGNVNVSDYSAFFDEQHIYEDYATDYGFEHGVNWGLGGFRYRPVTNTDYSKKQTTEILSTAPSVGFSEEVDFCTRILWSVTRPINVQDSPSVKTFPPGNKYDISDNTGEIKFAWDADSGKGNNLYAITNSGLCMLLVDKRILSEINADELATIGADSFGGITADLWINKDIGMDSETWRSWAEYGNKLFWVNSTSSYSFEGNAIVDIAKSEDMVRPGYSEILRRAFIPKMNKGVFSKIAGVYDILHNEYWATADNRGQSGDNFSTLIFGVTQDALQCQSDYRYDKYLAIDNKVYGMKGLETYELGVGNLLNGEEYECYVSGVSDADSYSDKEFIRIRVNSNSRPKRIEFYDDYDQYINGANPSSIVDATINPLNIKDYHGYECYIPRKTFAPYLRQQGRHVIFKIVSDDNEEFYIATAGVQYKALK